MEIGRVVRELMSAEELESALTSIANAIDQKLADDDTIILIGIRRRGVPLAERLASKLRDEGRKVQLGVIDITLYRDDLSEIGPVPMVGQTDITFNINGLPVVLVDDVLYTGRTIRAALDCLNDFGRPKKIQLAVIVDRGGRELPIAADYKGLAVEVEAHEHVALKVKTYDGEDRVVLKVLEEEEKE